MVKTAITTSGSEEAALQQAAVQQRQRVVDGLRRAPVSGRLVVHIRISQKGFPGSPDDIELRAGDTLEIPKQPGFVLIVGQVYNSNAITYTPGKNTAWYLSRAGGATGLANKKAIFIIRASGSVTSESGGCGPEGWSFNHWPRRHNYGSGASNGWQQRLEKPSSYCADRASRSIGGSRSNPVKPQRGKKMHSMG